MHLGSLNLVGDSPCHDDIPRFSRIFLSSKFCEIANLQDPRVTFPSHYSCAVFLQSFTKTSPPHMQRRPLKEHPLQPDLAWQRMSISKKVPIHHFVAHWLEVAARGRLTTGTPKASKELPPNQTHPSKSKKMSTWDLVRALVIADLPCYLGKKVTRSLEISGPKYQKWGPTLSWLIM